MKVDRIASSEPINAVASRVVQKGVHFNPNVAMLRDKRTLHSETPLPIFEKIPLNIRNNKTFRNLTGMKFGLFTVIGMSIIDENKNGAGWSVRCACGAYEIRRTKAIKNPLNTNDKCYVCQYEERLRSPERAAHVPRWYERRP